MIEEAFKAGKKARATVRLAERCEKQLLAYTIAAAGVAVVAGAQPSAAEVVYTPANLPIYNTGPVPLDVNNDGVADFYFYLGFNSFSNTSPQTDYQRYYLSVFGNRAFRTNTFVGVLQPSALPSSVLVGPYARFVTRSNRMASCSRALRTSGLFYETNGAFANKRSRYLGLKFVVNGEIHYGWARFDVSASAHDLSLSATLTGYAYETTPNAPIFTGRVASAIVAHGGSPEETTASRDAATLGHLARGARALSAWRRTKPALP